MYLQSACIYHALGIFFAHLILFHKIIDDHASNIICEVCICGFLFLKARRKDIYDIHLCVFSIRGRYITLVCHEFQNKVTSVLRYVIRIIACAFGFLIFGIRTAIVIIIFGFGFCLCLFVFDLVKRVVIYFFDFLIAFRIFCYKGIAVRCLRQSCQRSALGKSQITDIF